MSLDRRGLGLTAGGHITANRTRAMPVAWYASRARFAFTCVPRTRACVAASLRLERACLCRSNVRDPRVSCTGRSCSHAFRCHGSSGVVVARASAAARGFWQRPSFTFQATFFQPCQFIHQFNMQGTAFLSSLFFHFLFLFKVPLKVHSSGLKRKAAAHIGTDLDHYGLSLTN